MKEFVEKYPPVRQRAVQEQTTKDTEAGALPPAIYTRQQISIMWT